MTSKWYENACEALSLVKAPVHFDFSEFSEWNRLAEFSSSERLSAGLSVFMDLMEKRDFGGGRPVGNVKLDRTIIDRMISRIDAFLGQQLDDILHHEDFRALESIWRGLRFLVDRTDFQANINVDLLDASKEDLISDFEGYGDVTQSGLYRHLYIEEYDTPGGKPYSVVLSNYVFDSQHQDVQLLREIARVASAAHCPFLGSAAPRFFGKENMDDVVRIPSLREHFERPEFILWNQFREMEESRYIGLVLPKFLVRMPYGDHNPTRLIQYTEQIDLQSEPAYLWTSSVFAFGANMARSFKDYGWTVVIRGPEGGGKIDDLPLHQYLSAQGIETSLPVEILIPESLELELSELGFIPFSYYKGANYACFFSANSIHKPALLDSPEARSNARINARLPYIFLITRLGHYLKVLQRENLGSVKDRALLEQELNQWLNGLVTKMPNPSPDLIARRPLRFGQVSVSMSKDNPGQYRIELHVVPHFQVEGMDIKLALVSQLPS